MVIEELDGELTVSETVPFNSPHMSSSSLLIDIYNMFNTSKILSYLAGSNRPYIFFKQGIVKGSLHI